MVRAGLVVLLAGTVACGSSKSGEQPNSKLEYLTASKVPTGDPNCPAGGYFFTFSGGKTDFICNGQQGARGDTGATGPQGATGLTGPAGAQGPAGPATRRVVVDGNARTIGDFAGVTMLLGVREPLFIWVINDNFYAAYKSGGYYRTWSTGFIYPSTDCSGVPYIYQEQAIAYFDSFISVLAVAIGNPKDVSRLVSVSDAGIVPRSATDHDSTGAKICVPLPVDAQTLVSATQVRLEPVDFDTTLWNGGGFPWPLAVRTVQ